MTATGKKKKIFDNRYEILSIIGRGSRGVVYRARQVKSSAEQDIALKVLISKKGESSPAELLRKEALAMISCRHKYVIRLDDFHSMGDLCYLAMELAEKGDLRQYAKNLKGRIGLTQGELFMLQAAEGLEFVHRAGILHRDIKPDNLLVIDDRNIRIADFGVALLPGEDSSLEELQKGVGSLDYMAPEVLEGERYDKRSDLYALGMTFYEMLSGVHPFDGIPLARQIEAREDKNIPHLKELLPKAPDRLCSAIMQAISFNPGSRFNTSLELIERLLGKSSEKTKPSQESKQSSENQANTAETKAVNKPVLRSKISSPDTKKEQPKGLQNKQDGASKRDEQTKEQQDSKAQSSKPSPGRLRLKQKQAQPAPYKESVEKPPANKDQSQDTRTPKQEPKLKLKPKSADSEQKPKQESQRQNGQDSSSTKQEPPKPTPKPPEAKERSDNNIKTTKEREPTPDSKESKPRQHEARQDKKDVGNQMKQMVERHLEESKKSSRDSVSAKDKERDQGTESDRQVSSKKAEVDRSSDRKAEGDSSSNGSTKKKSLLLETPAKSPSPLPKIAAIAVLAAAGYFYFYYGSSEPAPDQPVPSSTQSVQDQPQHVLPPVANEALNWPFLPTGLYVGSVDNIIPGERIALSFFSHRTQGKLYLMLGIAGWTPQPIPLPDPDSGTYQVRVSANGMILDLRAEEVEGALIGVYQNTLSGQEGEWRAQPVR